MLVLGVELAFVVAMRTRNEDGVGLGSLYFMLVTFGERLSKPDGIAPWIRDEESSTPQRPGSFFREVAEVGHGDAVAETDLRFPAEGRQSGNIHELDGRTVGVGGIPHDAAGESDGRCDNFGEFLDRHVGAEADVDQVGGI